jgi:hypothetical protein
MYAPTLFREQPRQAQLLAVVVAPAVIGAIAGVLLGVSSAAYWIVGLLAAMGAFVAGFEHLGGRDAAARGLFAGALYGIALLPVHAIAERVDEALRGTVWETGGCTSFYIDASGRNATLWPDWTWRFRRLCERVDPAAYELSSRARELVRA